MRASYLVSTYPLLVLTQTARTPSPNPGASTASPNSFISGAPHNGALLVDASLAFIKAYRLKVDASSCFHQSLQAKRGHLYLKQVVLSVFDATLLAAAYKALRDMCGNFLWGCGLTYHSRRSSDKPATFVGPREPTHPSDRIDYG